MANELNYKEVWNGVYRGVSFEIVHWRLGWNYYIHIPLEQLPEYWQPKFDLHPQKSDLPSGCAYYDYYVSPIKDLDWHGGITFYEKHFDEYGRIDGFQLGCDYLHLWDEGINYNINIVKSDAEDTINKLLEIIPDLKMCCSWDGKFYPLSEMTKYDNGTYRANINVKK